MSPVLESLCIFNHLVLPGKLKSAAVTPGITSILGLLSFSGNFSLFLIMQKQPWGHSAYSVKMAQLAVYRRDGLSALYLLTVRNVSIFNKLLWGLRDFKQENMCSSLPSIQCYIYSTTSQHQIELRYFILTAQNKNKKLRKPYNHVTFYDQVLWR